MSGGAVNALITDTVERQQVDSTNYHHMIGSLNWLAVLLHSDNVELKRVHVVLQQSHEQTCYASMHGNVL